MKYEATFIALAGMAQVVLGEVPLEHSHQEVVTAVDKALKLNNPLEIQDAVFALLGNKAAAEGAPNVQNLDCLQQIVADQAFTNAKAAGDVDSQAAAIIFRALERNTGSVGLASVLCTEAAVNPEIAAITQHQDPASKEAAGNKDIALAVAVQLASIGADPNLAIDSGTFAPGKIGDPTAKGNTCDDANDPIGCIKTQNLLVPDVTEDEIAAAVAAAGGNVAAADNKAAAKDDKKAAAKDDKKAAAKDAKKADAAAAASNANNAAAASVTVNVQTFTGAIGGPAPPVESTAGSDRPFAVDGSTFVNAGAALQRSCSVQHNACANAVNSGKVSGGSAQCETQQAACEAATKGGAARRLKKLRLRAALDFGSCGEPAIIFADNLDGRKEPSFASADSKDFNHGSALNIKVIAQFNCDQLTNKCKASADTVAACDAAASKASGLKGQAAADAFNNALGISA